MESYVLRIVRCDAVKPTVKKQRAHDRYELVGLLETTGNGERLAFHNMEELWNLLTEINEITQPGHR